MATEVFVRGNTVQFTTRFYGLDGAALSPPGADLYLSYTVDGVTQGEQLAMAASGDAWVVTWESEQADAGTVYWSAHTTGSSPKAVEDGHFKLTANPANPAPYT